MGKTRVGLFAALMCTVATPCLAAANDTKGCAEKVKAARAKATPAQGEALLKQAYADCGDGHEILSTMALAAAAQGEFDRAAELCTREIGAPNWGRQAVDVLISLMPKLSAGARRKVLELGTTVEAPIYLASPPPLARLVEEVLCEGTPLTGMHETFDRKHQLFRRDLECPRGKVTTHYIRVPEETGSTKAGSRRAIDRVIEGAGLDEKFGISNATELRAALAGRPTADRSLGWLLGWVPDPLTGVKVMQLLVKQNPNDLASIINLADLQISLGERAQAMATLRAADPDAVSIVDSRSSGPTPAGLFSRQCMLLRRQNKLEEAAAMCAKAVSRGSRVNGPFYWAQVLYLQGKYEEALTKIESSIQAEERNQPAYVLAGLINQKLGRTDAARARFEGSYGLSKALRISVDDQRTPAEWLALFDRESDRSAADTLAACGHHYLDLELPRQSQACFAAAKKIDPRAVRIEMLEHQAETNPEAALKEAEGMLRESRDARLLSVVARAHAHAGQPQAGIPALREALYQLPPWDLPDELVRTVCVELPLAECMKQ